MSWKTSGGFLDYQIFLHFFSKFHIETGATENKKTELTV